MRMAAAAAMSSSLSFPPLFASPSRSLPRRQQQQQQQRSTLLLARRSPRVVLPASSLRGSRRRLRDLAPPVRASPSPEKGGDGGETPEGEDAAAATAGEAGGESAEAAESAEATARRILRERGGGGAGGDLAWAGVAEEVREIEWPAFRKVVGTTGVVLAVIAGSSVALLTVNAVLAELSDRVFVGSGVQDFFSRG